MLILATLLILFALPYAGCGCLLVLGIRRVRKAPLPEELPRVSVVVCARNEEANLPRCLDHLLRLDYPRDRREIILVDDESDDSTHAIMEDYANRDASIRVLTTRGVPRTLPGKQRPLAFGIGEATGDVILVTDADIAVRPGWIQAHLSAYHPTVGIVGGTTRVAARDGNRLWDSIQNCELLLKHAVGMGCVGLGYPLSIMGNNISFRRSVYEAVGGFAGLKATVVEDMALMNAVVNRTPLTLGWVADPEGTVESMPEHDLATFLNQRYRWVFEVTDLATIGKLVLGLEVAMLGCLALAILTAVIATPLPLVVLVTAWIGVYAAMLLASPGRERGDIWYLPAALALQVIEGVALGRWALARNRAMVWKGRTYSAAGTPPPEA